MKTIINIDGGLGRVITAIPALLKYGKNHPEDDWYVMIPGWDFMVWGIEELQQRTFNPETKGMFENYYWHADKVIAPEPYKLPAFYRNEISLIEAFDELINETTDHSDLSDMKLELTIDEILNAKGFINQAIQGINGNPTGCEPPKPVENHKKIIVFQPFGSTSQQSEMGIYDKSMRSINHLFATEIANALSKDYIVINMNGREGFSHFPGVINFAQDPDLRTWSAIIQEADYFVGCDSVGQHMARAFDKPGTVILGSTYAVNITYPDHFQIIENENVEKEYSPIRVCGLDSHLADRKNDRCMDFTDEEVDNIYSAIVKDIKEKVK